MLESLYYLTSEIAKIRGVIAVVLYGSYARGEAGRKSDIDLLIIVEDKAAEKKIKGIIHADETSRVVPSILTQEELAESPYYFYEILKDGIVLYKNPEIPLKIPFALPEKAVTLYGIDVSALDQRRKVKLNRALYGAKFHKKVKGKTIEYRYKGELEKIGGEMVGKGAIIIPSNAEKNIDALLDSYNVKYSKKYLILIAKD